MPDPAEKEKLQLDPCLWDFEECPFNSMPFHEPFWSILSKRNMFPKCSLLHSAAPYIFSQYAMSDQRGLVAIPPYEECVDGPAKLTAVRTVLTSSELSWLDLIKLDWN